MLAFDAAGGETAIEDVPLGQVSRKKKKKEKFSLFFQRFFFPVFFISFSLLGSFSLPRLPLSPLI